MSDRIPIDPRSVLRRLGGDRAKIRELARESGLNPDILEKWVAGKTRLSAGDEQKVAQALGLK